MGILKRNYLPSILCTLLYVNICDVQCFVRSYVSLSIDVCPIEWVCVCACNVNNFKIHFCAGWHYRYRTCNFVLTLYLAHKVHKCAWIYETTRPNVDAFNMCILLVGNQESRPHRDMDFLIVASIKIFNVIIFIKL